MSEATMWMPSPPEQITLAAVTSEVIRARLKFPSNKHLLTALVEEVGELAQAMLQDKPRDEIQREAIQVACVAMRIVEEGDSAFDVKDWSTDA
jgi:NTP pyrophosphatase (non-canonical NTP hydrolase)